MQHKLQQLEAENKKLSKTIEYLRQTLHDNNFLECGNCETFLYHNYGDHDHGTCNHCKRLFCEKECSDECLSECAACKLLFCGRCKLYPPKIENKYYCNQCFNTSEISTWIPDNIEFLTPSHKTRILTMLLVWKRKKVLIPKYLKFMIFNYMMDKYKKLQHLALGLCTYKFSEFTSCNYPLFAKNQKYCEGCSTH